MSDLFGSDVGEDESAGLFETAQPDEAAAPRSVSGPVPVDHRAPLAVRMRPRTLGEVVGQQHLLGPGAPLRRLVEGSGAASVLLYGPPGTGKTYSTAAEAVRLCDGTVPPDREALKGRYEQLVEAGQYKILHLDAIYPFGSIGVMRLEDESGGAALQLADFLAKYAAASP